MRSSLFGSTPPYWYGDPKDPDEDIHAVRDGSEYFAIMMESYFFNRAELNRVAMENSHFIWNDPQYRKRTPVRSADSGDVAGDENSSTASAR